MARLFYPNSPYVETLTQAGVDVTRTLEDAYESFRVERNQWWEPIDDAYIASNPFCMDISPKITKALVRQLGLGSTSLRAHLEIHTLEDDGHHVYSTVGPEGADPAEDIVIDATYKQFLPQNIRNLRPHAYIGDRAGIAAIMEQSDFSIAAGYYRVDTLNTASEIYLVDTAAWGIAHRTSF